MSRASTSGMSNPKTNAYRSSESVIVSGPGTMYNEVTRPKSNARQYNANTNTHDVTVPYVKTRRSKSTKGGKRKQKKVNRKS